MDGRLFTPWSLKPVTPAVSVPRPRWFSQRKSRVVWQRRLGRYVGRLPLIGSTYLSKLSVPPFGGMGLALTIPLMFLLTIAGFASGVMVLHLRRALFFAVMVALLLVLQVVAADSFSLGSLALLVVVHLPYIVQQRRQERARDDVLRYFQRLALVIGVLGIVQYVVQFVIGPTLAYPIENLVPAALKVAHFNSTGQLQYGSDIMRANGVFMVEPSFFSQLMAVGIVVEIVTRKRPLFVAVMGLAILVSYSGTGIMLLAVCLVCECVTRHRWDLLLGIVAATGLLMGVGVAADIPMITNILGRASEFGAAGSSASMRFVGGFQLFQQFLWPDPFHALFGFGAGSLVEFGARSIMPFAETILFKPIFEYGLIGGSVYFGFLIYSIFTASSPMAVRVAVWMAIMLGGMYTPFGHCLACGLVLWRNVPADAAAGARRLRGRARPALTALPRGPASGESSAAGRLRRRAPFLAAR